MSDILKQIQALQEQFSNLFEVDGDGLGNPAVDVPPSQNKIKRDRRTKDGKVELVSVEDELFPYDGNKKEQYRQKILDTINGMIQGTATLEDLLQIVRQKKAPLKEAMEVLESIINEKHVFPKKAVEDGNKKYLEADKKNNEATRLARKGFEKLNKKIKELEGKGIDTDVDIEPGVTYGNGPKKEYQQALKTADALHTAQREADREETKARNNQRKLRAEGLKGVVMRQFDYVPTKKGDSFNVKKVLDKNEALEEAMEIMEEIINEISNKTVESALDKSNHDAVMSLFKLPQTTFHKYKKLKDMADRRAERHGERIEVDDSGEKCKHTHGKGPIEEALEIMEAIINEVSMDKWKEAAASSLPKRQEKALKSEEEGKQIWKDYEEASKKSPEDEPSLYRKAEKDAEAHAEEHKKNVDRASQAELVSMLKTKGKSANKTIKAAKKVQDERSEDFYENPNAKTLSRKVKASSVAAADPVKSRNEADQ